MGGLAAGIPESSVLLTAAYPPTDLSVAASRQHFSFHSPSLVLAKPFSTTITHTMLIGDGYGSLGPLHQTIPEAPVAKPCQTTTQNVLLRPEMWRARADIEL